MPPEELHKEFPVSDQAASLIFSTRNQIHKILTGEDDRLLVIIGPCSIHDPEAGREYASRLKDKIKEYEKDLCIVMRFYFEKPRTTVGWKGLINDPYLDNSFKINEGLRLGRHLLVDLAEMGVPAATEFLDLISPQYIADLISWGAIGARTTESQGHRELASGLSCPVGFKNSTNGGLGIAIDAIHAASRPHVFMSLTKRGHSAIFSTKGNEDCHIILRGGNGKPNYDAASINHAAIELEKKSEPANIMVDCSHANSDKDYKKQINVCHDLAHQISAGDQRIFGLMIESHLVEGRQDIDDECLTYGQSITDACVGWDDSLAMLDELAIAVQERRKKNS
ncbi:MAG: 3-deoxy-7-phosphoheptulonate synthase [Gammaproteobacteria bacterium]|nr:3-deoxy-7-phosphoheptulonate synthase [Gammaproteobacteria bacterium]